VQLFYPSAVEVTSVDEEGNIIEQPPRPRQDDDEDEDIDSLTGNVTYSCIYLGD